MIIGIGCDIIEVDRVRRAIERDSFKQRVFTVAETAYCESRGKQGAASFAARFAVKEAVLKALGIGLRGGALTEIEVTNDELGKPCVKLSGYHGEMAERLGVRQLHVSISHSRDNAMAYVIMEG